MYKRIITLIFAIVMWTAALLPTFAAPATVPAEISAISTNNVVLYDANSGVFLYDKNGEKTAYPASTTKVLTATIILDICEGRNYLGDIYSYFEDSSWIKENYKTKSFSLDDVVTVRNPETRGSVMGIHDGEQLTVRDLMYGMMLVSGNDCARALALYFSPDETVPGFAKLMNGYAKELGAESSHFVVPHGLHDDSHVTTARDMAFITKYALKNKTFREIVGTEVYNIAPTNRNSEGYILENTNRLIHTKLDDTEVYKYEYAIGVKTGDTDAAGRCIIAAAEKEGRLLIAVLFGDHENSRIGSPRYVNAKKLFEYGFNDFVMVKASELDIEPTIRGEVKGADVGTAELTVDLENAGLCLQKDEAEVVKANAKYFTVKTTYKDGDVLNAPINAGDNVGYVEYMYNGEVVLRADLIAANNIKEAEGNATTGTVVEPVDAPDISGNEWIFWLLLVCILLLIIVVITMITKQPARRRNSQLRRRSHR